MTTIYTFHRASDHEIIETATPGNLQKMAAHIARRIHAGLPDREQKTSRVYVHNGLGIITVGIIRQDLWHDALRDDYLQFEPKARAIREARGFPNDPPPQA